MCLKKLNFIQVCEYEMRQKELLKHVLPTLVEFCEKNIKLLLGQSEPLLYLVTTQFLFKFLTFFISSSFAQYTVITLIFFSDFRNKYSKIFKKKERFGRKS